MTIIWRAMPLIWQASSMVKILWLAGMAMTPCLVMAEPDILSGGSGDDYLNGDNEALEAIYQGNDTAWMVRW